MKHGAVNEPLARLLHLVGPDAASLAPDAQADLLATIQENIIPQLALAHAAAPKEIEPCPDARLPPTPAEVSEFARIVVAEDVPGALAFIEKMAYDGLSLEVILLNLVAPAATLLGEEWEADLRSFTEVTIGLSTLHQVVHVLAPSFSTSPNNRGCVVLVAAPAEQHTLGIYLLAEFLRKAGWGVIVDPTMPREELLSLVATERVEMVGISVSNTDLVAPLTRLVTSIRQSSMNGDVAIMMGGSLRLAGDALEIGATFCNDPREAVKLLDQHARRGLHSS